MHCHEVFATELRCSPGHVVLEVLGGHYVPKLAVTSRKSGERYPGMLYQALVGIFHFE